MNDIIGPHQLFELGFNEARALRVCHNARGLRIASW